MPAGEKDVGLIDSLGMIVAADAEKHLSDSVYSESLGEPVIRILIDGPPNVEVGLITNQLPLLKIEIASS